MSINALRPGSWIVTGWMVCGLLCLAQCSRAQIVPTRPNGEGSQNGAVLPLQLVVSDSQGSAGIFKNGPTEGPLVMEIPRPSLERMAYLSGLFVVLSAMLAWHCSNLLRKRRSESPIANRSMLAGEQGSPELVSLVRTALVPKFTEWLNSRAVRQLIAQRDGLRWTQEVAELELAKLEEMLIEVHAPLHERIRGYEQRIAELEEALAAKGNEGRELIETMIHLTRQRLETEQHASAESAPCSF